MDTPLGDDAPPWFTGGRVPGRVWSKACGNPWRSLCPPVRTREWRIYDDSW